MGNDGFWIGMIIIAFILFIFMANRNGIQYGKGSAICEMHGGYIFSPSTGDTAICKIVSEDGSITTKEYAIEFAKRFPDIEMAKTEMDGEPEEE